MPEPAQCAVDLTLSVIGGRWKPLILRHLFFDGTHRFGQLRRKLPGVTQRVLTRQLRDLEHDGILQRTVLPTSPPQVEYALTEEGRTLGPILEAMRVWGEARQRRSEGALSA